MNWLPLSSTGFTKGAADRRLPAGSVGSGVTRLAYCGSVLHTRSSGLFATREPLQIGVEHERMQDRRGVREAARFHDHAVVVDHLTGASSRAPRLRPSHQNAANATRYIRPYQRIAMGPKL